MLESPGRELTAVIEPGEEYALDWQYSDRDLPHAGEEWQENFYYHGRNSQDNYGREMNKRGRPKGKFQPRRFIDMNWGWRRRS